ncbi:MAG: GNAT family N-acetyltransferase [Verrucomicrobiota bacterium]
MIRPATNADRDAIEALVFSVLADYDLQVFPESTDADLKDIEGHYINRGGAFDVYLNAQEEIVGTVGLYRIDDRICELRKMYLYPEQRGKGIGKQLLEHALLKAKHLEFSQVTLETASKLKEAIHLYKRYGFEAFEPEHLAGRCDQAFVKDL